MIIPQNNKYIQKDFDTLFNLSNNFMQFRNHNIEFSKVLRQQIYFIDNVKNGTFENKKYKGRFKTSAISTLSSIGCFTPQIS